MTVEEVVAAHEGRHAAAAVLLGVPAFEAAIEDWGGQIRPE